MFYVRHLHANKSISRSGVGGTQPCFDVVIERTRCALLNKSGQFLFIWTSKVCAWQTLRWLQIEGTEANFLFWPLHQYSTPVSIRNHREQKTAKGWWLISFVLLLGLIYFGLLKSWVIDCNKEKGGDLHVINDDLKPDWLVIYRRLSRPAPTCALPKWSPITGKGELQQICISKPWKNDVELS